MGCGAGNCPGLPDDSGPCHCGVRACVRSRGSGGQRVVGVLVLAFMGALSIVEVIGGGWLLAGPRARGVGAAPVWVVAGGPTLGTVRLSTRSASFTVPRTFHEKPSGAIFH